MVGGSNGQTIRGALIDLIKFYVGRDIKFEELSCLLGCICAVHDEVVVRTTVTVVVIADCGTVFQLIADKLALTLNSLSGL